MTTQRCVDFLNIVNQSQPNIQRRLILNKFQELFGQQPPQHLSISELRIIVGYEIQYNELRSNNQLKTKKGEFITKNRLASLKLLKDKKKNLDNFTESTRKVLKNLNQGVEMSSKKKESKITMKDVAVPLILKNDKAKLTDDEIIKEVVKKVECNCNKACLAWYRNKLNKGELNGYNKSSTPLYSYKPEKTKKQDIKKTKKKAKLKKK